MRLGARQLDVRRDAVAAGVLTRSMSPDESTLILPCEDADDLVRKHL
jgi:hypothetical protein